MFARATLFFGDGVMNEFVRQISAVWIISSQAHEDSSATILDNSSISAYPCQNAFFRDAY
jgi:hypothetical protein